MKINVNCLDINIVECKSIYKRTKGFMFKRKKITYGFLFNKCNAIHTFFMRQPIDIIMTDEDDNIIFMEEALKPWHIIMPKKGAIKTYELPLGSIKKIEHK